MFGAEQIHLLDIGVPIELRPALLEEAARYGIHCLLEWPMSPSPGGTHHVLSEIRRQGICLTVDSPAGRDPVVLQSVALSATSILGSAREMVIDTPVRDLLWQEGLCDWLPEELQPAGITLAAGMILSAPLLLGLIGMPAEIQVSRIVDSKAGDGDVHLRGGETGQSNSSGHSAINLGIDFRYVNQIGSIKIGESEELLAEVDCSAGRLRIEHERVRAWDSAGVEIDCSPWIAEPLSGPSALLKSITHGPVAGDLRGPQAACDLQDIVYSALLSLAQDRAVRVRWK